MIASTIIARPLQLRRATTKVSNYLRQALGCLAAVARVKGANAAAKAGVQKRTLGHLSTISRGSPSKARWSAGQMDKKEAPIGGAGLLSPGWNLGTDRNSKCANR